MEDTRPFCAGVEHAYAAITVIWCPHEQSWTLHATSWLEPGVEGPEALQSAIVRFGPFDDAADVLADAERRLVDAMRRLAGA